MSTTPAAPPPHAAAHRDLVAALESAAASTLDHTLSLAINQLSRHGDLHLLSAILKALVRAGIPGLAVRLLRSNPALLAAQPQLDALAAQLASLPTGCIAPTQLKSQLARNLPLVLDTNPHLAPHAAALESLDPFLVAYRTAAGNTCITRETPDNRLSILLPLSDEAAAASSIVPSKIDLTHAFVLRGCPTPTLFNTLLAARSYHHYEPPLDILESDPSFLALWLSLITLNPADLASRVRIFTGENAVQSWLAYLANHPLRSLPSQAIDTLRLNALLPAIEPATLDPVRAAHEVWQRSRLNRQLTAYADKTPAFWCTRYAAASCENPIRVIGFTTRYSTVMQHAMRDLAAAFLRQSCAFDLAIEPDASTSLVDTWSPLATGDADLVIVINHLRSEMPDRLTPNIPFVCWIQDHMPALQAPTAGASITDLDLVLAHQAGEFVSSFNYPRASILETSNLTDPVTYSNDPLPEAELAPLRCDLAYVGHGCETPRQLIETIASPSQSRLRTYLHTIADLIASRLQDQFELSFLDLLELILVAERESNHPPLTPAQRRAAVHPAAVRIYDRILRHQTLQWAADWAARSNRSFRIFGRNWHEHPTLAPHAAGEIPNGLPLRALYQAATITLHATAWQSLHQRLLDGFAAGGFILTRRNTADFCRGHFLAIHRHITAHHITRFDDLLRSRAEHADLDAAARFLERAELAFLQPASHPDRQRQTALMRDVFDMPPAQTADDAVLDTLRTMRFVPPRAAGDLPGFDRLTFDSAASLHTQLTSFTADPAARASLAAPVRDSILKHDTFDVLANRILQHFATLQPVNPHINPVT